MTTAPPPPVAQDPGSLLDALRRRRTARLRLVAAVLVPAAIVAGAVAWKVVPHLIAATRLEARGFLVTWRVDRQDWRQGGATTAEVAPPLLGFVGDGRGTAVLEDLGRLHRLERLDLAKLDGLNDDELAPLSGLTDLTELSLDQRFAHNWFARQKVRPTDATLARLGHLKRLRDLNLAGNRITDAGLAHLAGLVDLQILDLADTAITDAGLESLHGLRRLRYINLEGTKATPVGARALKAAVPGADVDFSSAISRPR